MNARLFTIPASHPSWTARLMLDRKGIPYKRVDLVAAVHKPALRALGFASSTVPALRLDGRRVQGSREISRALDEVVPEPRLFPSDPAQRAKVEEAERWGDEVLQPVPRRIAWGILSRDRSPIRSYLEGSRLGIPTSIAAATSAPIVAVAARYNKADDAHVRADLEALPGLIDHVDSLIADGVIGGAEPNAADFQIATSIALLLTFDDIRPLITGRPAEELANRLAPAFPGHAGPTLPAGLLEPLRRA
jgi:glutathione S-transferase